MLDWTEIVLRLGAATVIGAIMGLNRDLHNKPTGVRTLSLVGLGPCLIVLASLTAIGSTDLAATSRIMQGVVTGIGFLGAGVILKVEDHVKVRGMTTAAGIWLTAALGLACGLGAWRVVLPATALAAIVLVFGGPFERRAHTWLTGGAADDPNEDNRTK